MSNKINGLDNRPIRIGAGTPVSATGKRASEQPSASPQQPESDVLITGAARSLAALEAQLRELPVIDAARVADVQKRLEEGRYAVDPQRIADRLLRLENELGTVRPQIES
jgi:negative regulator of flagellin synthesis FlgM